MAIRTHIIHREILFFNILDSWPVTSWFLRKFALSQVPFRPLAKEFQLLVDQTCC